MIPPENKPSLVHTEVQPKRKRFSLSVRMVASGAALLTFSALWLDLQYQGIGFKVDHFISVEMEQLHAYWLNWAMLIFSELSGIYISVLTVIVLSIYFFVKKRAGTVLFMLTSLAGSTFLFEFFKFFIRRDRPQNKLIEVPQFSFPSGHATISATFALVIFLAFRTRVRRPTLLAVGCLSYALLISFTRVYLNVHYLMDVLAGMALAVCWVGFISIVKDEKLWS